MKILMFIVKIIPFIIGAVAGIVILLGQISSGAFEAGFSFFIKD